MIHNSEGTHSQVNAGLLLIYCCLKGKKESKKKPFNSNILIELEKKKLTKKKVLAFYLIRF